MAWLAVDKDGTERIFKRRPSRVLDGRGTSVGIEYWIDMHSINSESYYFNFRRGDDKSFVLPKGSIRKLIGRELTWEDDPVEIKDQYCYEKR